MIIHFYWHPWHFRKKKSIWPALQTLHASYNQQPTWSVWDKKKLCVFTSVSFSMPARPLKVSHLWGTAWQPDLMNGAFQEWGLTFHIAALPGKWTDNWWKWPAGHSEPSHLALLLSKGGKCTLAAVTEMKGRAVRLHFFLNWWSWTRQPDDAT